MLHNLQQQRVRTISHRWGQLPEATKQLWEPLGNTMGLYRNDAYMSVNLRRVIRNKLPIDSPN